MPFALLIIGIVLLIAAVRGTHSDLFALVKGDFIGPNNFIFWTVSILIIGSVGYIPKLKPLSVAFLVVVILVLILTKGNPTQATGGFFEKFTSAISGVGAAATTSKPAATASQAFTLPTIPTFMF